MTFFRFLIQILGFLGLKVATVHKNDITLAKTALKNTLFFCPMGQKSLSRSLQELEVGPFSGPYLLVSVKEEGWTGFSEGWQGFSEGNPKEQPCQPHENPVLISLKYKSD